jgi:enediyne biosynthesis protein E4
MLRSCCVGRSRMQSRCFGGLGWKSLGHDGRRLANGGVLLDTAPACDSGDGGGDRIGVSVERLRRKMTKMCSKVSVRVAILTGAWVICVVGHGCSKDDDASANRRDGSVAGRTVFVDVTAAAGVVHVHHKPILDAKLSNIMSWVSSVGAAAAAADVDGDGWMDLYLTDSRKGEPNRLFRNNGDGTFSDIASAAGVAEVNNDGGVSMDCVFGDYDNDGFPDLFVVRWGRDVLFRNNGDGTFADVSDRVFSRSDGGAGSEWANGNAAIFYDYNLDGLLDLYVGNYFDDVDLWNLESTRIMHDDFERARNGGRNFLFRGNSDGTFTEVGKSLGVDDPGWTLAVGSADVNNDGWPDLYCADDFGPDQLFVNRGDGTFANETETAIGFDTKKGMNVDFGDINNDGWLDVYVTNITTAEYLREGNMLWHNNGLNDRGDVWFTDIAVETGTQDGGWGWGGKFFDYDSDGHLDLFTVNGFISAGEGNYWYDLASWTVLGEDAAEARNWPPIGDRSFSGHERFRFWRNQGFETFTQRANEVGLDSDRDGRGIVVFDYDNDGDLDVYVANQNQAGQLFRNDGRSSGHWLQIALDTGGADGVNRDAIGARVTVVTDDGLQIRERDGGNGFCGQSDPRIYFGLGANKTAKLIEIRWPDGKLQYLENVSADQMVAVARDASVLVTQSAIAAPTAEQRARAAADYVQAEVAADPAEVDRLLDEMERRIRAEPDRLALGDAYRARCVSFGRYERAIDFYVDLVARDPSRLVPAIQLSAAYIDKIPTCGGIAAIVSKGTLARKALDVINRVESLHSDSWLVYYARGMNHLHWPRALRHSDDAVQDFETCMKLQDADGASGVREYYERVFVALGDAHAKNKDYAAARKTWRAGLKAFPDSQAIATRLKIVDDKSLLRFVEDVRGLEKPIDTGFAFLERSP